MRCALIYISLSFVLFLLCVSCSKSPAAQVQIQQQRSGDYVLTLLNDSGVVKQHSNKYTLEIRNASSNELANVSNVQIQASMRMPGMGPMFGNISAQKQLARRTFRDRSRFRDGRTVAVRRDIRAQRTRSV